MLAISKIRKIHSVNGIFTKKRGLLHIPTCSSRPTNKHFLVLLLLLLLLIIIIIINNNDMCIDAPFSPINAKKITNKLLLLLHSQVVCVPRRLTDASDP